MSRLNPFKWLDWFDLRYFLSNFRFYVKSKHWVIFSSSGCESRLSYLQLDQNFVIIYWIISSKRVSDVWFSVKEKKDSRWITVRTRMWIGRLRPDLYSGLFQLLQNRVSLWTEPGFLGPIRTVGAFCCVWSPRCVCSCSSAGFNEFLSYFLSASTETWIIDAAEILFLLQQEPFLLDEQIDH